MKNKQIFFTGVHKAELLETEIPSVIPPGDVLAETVYTVISGGTERACIMGMDNTPKKFPMTLWEVCCAAALMPKRRAFCRRLSKTSGRLWKTAQFARGYIKHSRLVRSMKRKAYWSALKIRVKWY